jgi:hypothetical protein
VISIINELAVVFTKEGLFKKAYNYLAKALISRSIEIDSNFGIYQLAVLLANVFNILIISSLRL